MNTAAELAAWQGAPVASWRARWQVPALSIFAAIGSTNDALRAAAAAGAPGGTVAIADFQTGGRGRFGRVWEAPAGSALLCSLLLRPGPGGAPEAAGALPLRVGLAVAQSLETLCGARATLKWPNDVLLGEAKVAGILCEGAGDFVIVGVGVNLRQEPADFPPELAGAATSLRLATGHDPGAPALAGALIERLRPLFAAPHRPLDQAELAAFAARDALRGRQVTVDGASAGVAAGIEPHGALLLDQVGAVRAIHAGTVRTEP